MPIIRTVHNQENPYVMINKKALWDIRMSPRATVLWARMLSRPDNWNICVTEISKAFKQSLKATYKSLNELIELGYAYKVQEKKEEDGHFDKVQYFIFESCESCEEFKKSFRSAQNDYAVTVSAEKESLIKNNLNLTKERKKKDNILSSDVPSDSAERATSSISKIYENQKDIDEVYECFVEELLKCKPDCKKHSPEKWKNDIEKLLRIDKRSKDASISVIKWSFKDYFWKARILSIENLRKHFDTLEIQIEASKDLSWISINKSFAYKCIKENSPKLNHLVFSKYVITNPKNGKDVGLDMHPENFKKMFAHIVGGTYV